MQAGAQARDTRWWTLPRLASPLFDQLLPGSTWVNRTIACVAFIALIFVCAKARFYLPGNPTPVTLQTFGVLLTGGVMGWRWGMGAVLGYIALGALGLPVFAGEEPLALRTPAEAWSSAILGVTGGYIIGFVVAAGVTGFLSQAGLARAGSLWAITLGGLLLYVPALIWLGYGDFGWPKEGELLMQGMYIYMPGDITKILAASFITGALWKQGNRYVDAVKRSWEALTARLRR